MDLQETSGIFVILDRIRTTQLTMARRQIEQQRLLKAVDRSIRSLKAKKSPMSSLKSIFGSSWVTWMTSLLILHYLAKGGDIGTAVSWLVKMK